MKLKKFKRFPVVILPEDHGEYAPGQPLPPGAIINQPLPNWVWFALVAVVILITALLLPKADKPSAAAVSPGPTVESLIEITFATFTPQAQHPPVVTLDKLAGSAKDIVTITVERDLVSAVLVNFDGRGIQNGQSKSIDGKVYMSFAIPSVSPGPHEVMVHVISQGEPPLKQTFTFEVMP